MSDKGFAYIRKDEADTIMGLLGQGWRLNELGRRRGWTPTGRHWCWLTFGHKWSSRLMLGAWECRWCGVRKLHV